MSSDSVAERVFDAVAASAPEVRASLPGRRAYLDDENPSGESMLAADAHADDLLADRLTGVDGVGAYASEEREAVVEADESGGVSVACDPLDGSSNLKSNNPMGTIVGVYDGDLPASGRDLLGAAYVLYGPVTTMVCARDGAARDYLVADGEREDLGDLSLPEEPTVYGFGGRVPDWPDAFASYVEELEEDELKLRYGGAMVADVSQVLTYGGVFGYPALESAPEGKLRLQFEANPVGYLVEAAGGRSSDGEGSVLDREAASLHERTPVHVGNAALVDRLEAALA
ncbi:class 1 fructose-bisphosphatase [Candidatus Halobonum tyrrellensis]|uniref:Fructose-1,6-bisphosphatase class 1 n=1 Tax=Candidatus Halobonum tyrrellensis G22 TaxID=1324957 RepID=V4IZJ3_9EURY|nr:fructose-bisphosphatase class I [Candidatus Halobonum tyrrellensis]ESP88557.1 fructose-1,6-bisphosphatase [Candidatus Halobonum tyrrellensis G22]